MEAIITLNNIGGASPGISGAISCTALGSCHFQGTIYNANTQTYTATTSFEVESGETTTFTTNGNPFTMAGVNTNLSASSNLNVATTSADINIGPLRAVPNDLRQVTLNSGTADVHLFGAGIPAQGMFSSLSLIGNDLYIEEITVANAISMTPAAAGTIFFRNSLITLNNSLQFTRPVILDSNNSVTLATFGGDIVFQETVNGNAPFARTLNLSTLTGSIDFQETTGGLFP